MMRRWTVPVLLFLAVPACGGKVVLSNETTASVTSASVGGSGGSGGEGSGGVGGTGGIGGAPVCTETHDELNVELITWEGKSYGCNLGLSNFEFSAAVVDSPGAGLLVLDSCSPAADCTPFLSKLSISAPGVYLDVPQGTFVKVHIAIIPFMNGCGQRIQITNLPSWDGEVNPVMGGDVLWFLGVDGSVEAFPDTPVSVTTDALGCFPGEPPRLWLSRRLRLALPERLGSQGSRRRRADGRHGEHDVGLPPARLPDCERPQPPQLFDGHLRRPDGDRLLDGARLRPRLRGRRDSPALDAGSPGLAGRWPRSELFTRRRASLGPLGSRGSRARRAVELDDGRAGSAGPN